MLQKKLTSRRLLTSTFGILIMVGLVLFGTIANQDFNVSEELVEDMAAKITILVLAGIAGFTLTDFFEIAASNARKYDVDDKALALGNAILHVLADTIEDVKTELETHSVENENPPE